MCFRLTALEIHNYVLHMTNLEQHIMSQKKNKQRYVYVIAFMN